MSFEAKEEQQEEEDHEANFQFFLELAKPLILELPLLEDRVLASAWVTRLGTEPTTDEEKRIRVDYLKLLLFVMQRGRLIGTFRDKPPDTLQPFPPGFGLAEMGNLLLEQAELQRTDANATGVSYSVDISNDLKEFVAAQEIPHFGVHVYYACSMEEPIHKWSSFDENKFPQYVQDKISQLKMINSEEKTHIPNVGMYPGDGATRMICDSSIYDRTKVKSPEEIERSLDRCSSSYASPSVQGSSNDEDKSWSSGKKSSSSSKKGTPTESLRNVDLNVAMISSDGFQATEKYDFDSAGGLNDQDMSICKCSHHYVSQRPETSKQLQKFENGGEKGGPFMRDMAGSGQRNSDRCEEMFAGNPRWGSGNFNKEKPICPAARFYQMNQATAAPLMKSRKTVCSSQDYPEDGRMKLNYNKPTSAKACNATSTSRPPCPCTCPRESETKDASRPKKKLAEKSCSKVAKAPITEVHTQRTLARDGMDDVHVKGQYRMSIDNVNTIEGCDCLEGATTARRLEGLERLGLGKTTPDNCGVEIKTSQQQQCVSGRRDGRERQEKAQLAFQPQEEAKPASCIKTRTRIVGEQLCEANKKANSCPPPRTKPSNMNSACQQMSKPGTEDYRGPSRFIRPEYGASSYGAKKTNRDLGSFAPPQCSERNFLDKRYDTEAKNIQYSPRQQQQQQECGIEGTGKDEKRTLLEAAMQHMISPCTPREFIDVFSSSSADEHCPDMEGQDEAGNPRNTGKYEEYAGENSEEDAGAGVVCSSSSENAVVGGAGQNFDDYEVNECRKAIPQRRPYTDPRETRVCAQVPSHMPEQQHSMPCNLGNAPGPMPFNPPPPKYNQTGQPCQLDYGGGKPPYSVPPNSPNYNQPGQPYSVVFGAADQFGQPHFSSLQGCYNQPGPGQFPMTYTAGNPPYPGSYNPPQPTYGQMQQFSLPCGTGNQNPAYGSAQGNYNQFPIQKLPQSDVYSAPSRQRQSPDTRPSEGNRRGMSIDPRDFPLSLIDQYVMPATSTPCNTSQPPPPPHFLLSPIVPSPGQPWSRFGGGMSCQRFQTASEGSARCGGETMEAGALRCGGKSMEMSKDWVSPKGFRRPPKAKTYSRTTDLSSDTKSRMEPDSIAQNEFTGSSMSCQYGSYEESPKWRELPKSTRFPRKPADSLL